MLVTTTNSIEGKTIKDYHGLVRASVILGTNVLSDFTASLTDFLGGRSGTYEKKIQLIYDEVMEQLEMNAFIKGANCVLGLKLDIDEISGKGAQMFMITAYGTAASMVQSGAVGIVEGKTINSRLMENKVKGRMLMKEHPDTIFNSEEHVAFIGNSGLEELADITLNILHKFSTKEAKINAGVDESNKKLSLLSNYFRNADWSKIKDKMYAEFYKRDRYLYLDLLKNIIIANQQVDFDICLRMIKSKNITAAKYGLAFVAAGKQSYKHSDVHLLTQLSNAIGTEFTPVGIVSSKKKLLSSTEVEVWECPCKKVNDGDQQYCSNCRNDIYGFTKEEVKPKEILTLLDDRIVVLTELLN